MRSKLLSLLLPAVLPGCGDCFVTGTRVDTPRGAVPIDELDAGDEVWSFSLEEGRRVARPVRAALRRRVREVRTIRAGERLIAGVTAEHPLYDFARREYRPVRDFAVRDVLASFDGAGLAAHAIDSITASEVAAARIDVFNLTIDGPEANYFVEGLLVHNKSPVDPPCPDGTAIIAVHAEADASIQPEGDFDVTLARSSDLSTFSVLIMRDGDDRNAPPQSVEKVSAMAYRARLINPVPGHYDISAFGYLAVGAPDYCQLATVRREFTISGAVPDAGDPDAGTDGD